MRLLSDLLTSAVFQEVQANRPRYFVADNLKWVDDAIHRATGKVQAPIAEVLDVRFEHEFSGVRAFHGCKPQSIESYRKHGIQLSSIEELNSRALQLFGDNDRTRSVIHEFRAVEASYCAHNEGKVFFCLDAEMFVDRSSQYVAYGSEYLICLAARLGAHDQLRKTGVATIIEVNVPFRAIPENFRRGIVGDIICELFQRRFERSETGGAHDCGFYVSEKIPPEQIVAFHYPKAARDPYVGGTYRQECPLHRIEQENIDSSIRSR